VLFKKLLTVIIKGTMQRTNKTIVIIILTFGIVSILLPLLPLALPVGQVQSGGCICFDCVTFG